MSISNVKIEKDRMGPYRKTPLLKDPYADFLGFHPISKGKAHRVQ
jgi:hypothetical protein